MDTEANWISLSDKDLAQLRAASAQALDLLSRIVGILNKHENGAAGRTEAPVAQEKAPEPAAPSQPASSSEREISGSSVTPSFSSIPSAPSSPSRWLEGMTLRQAVIAVLRKAGRPLTFQQVYQELQAGGAPLPAEKPMLKVRGVLYNTDTFVIRHGAFELRQP